MKVDTFADLVNPDSWTLANGDRWIYAGMIVSVSIDSDISKNGIYMLLDPNNFTNEAAWYKCANDADIAALRKQIEEIEVSSSADIEVGNFD
jgi:hypothetical protein